MAGRKLVRYALAVAGGVLACLWGYAGAVASTGPVALCPKVEYRVITRRGLEVRDTITQIPAECR